ncbi:MAG TPA: NADH-quinone oxidoreductase subunit NuoK [Planctomycetota bacterium]|jgi:NADH-quinone oxidoreductase subunit K
MNWLSGGPDNLTNYLVLSSILFACGIFAMISRRNAIGILMGVELILNAAGINFVAFSRFWHHPQTGFAMPGPHFDGQIFTLFIIVLAAAEAAVALALILAVFQTHNTIALEKVDELKM